MSTGRQLFRIVCLLQMLVTVFYGFISLSNFIRIGRFYFMLEAIFFLLIAALAILGISLLHTNYPDKPVAGKQKSIFNWLFLFNFLLLAFLFGLFFSEYRQLNLLREYGGRRVISLPFKVLTPLFISLGLLIFQFIILYGLFTLRRELFLNYIRDKQFEFEEEKKVR
jgi:hypothetical protein